MTFSQNTHFIGIISGLILSSIITTPVLADNTNGKSLHDSKCTSCHISMQGGDGSKIYTREDRRVTSRDALEQQVQRCNINVRAGLSDTDVSAVTNYLSSTFYKF